MAGKTDAPEDDDADDTGESAEVPWDDQTDAFINDIDSSVSEKYGVSLRTLLADPESYADREGIVDTIKNVKEEASSYFENMMDDLKPEQDELAKNMEEADALYTKIDQAVSSKAAIARVPYFKPISVDFGEETPETISIDEYNNNIDTLLAKFINISNYIANTSTTYKKYNLGSWLFSGERSYILAVNQPDSMVMTVENAQQYIEDALDGVSDLLSNAAPAK